MVPETIEILKQIRKSGTEHVAVSYSGGKDSIAVLDLCASVFPKVSAWFQYIVAGLEVEEKNLRFAEKRYGISILRIPSPALVKMMRVGYYLPKPIDFRRHWTFQDVVKTIRRETSATALAFGHRMDESLQRRGMLKNSDPCPEYNRKLGKLYPLANWHAKDVYQYLQARRIPIPENLGRWDTSGVSLGTDTLRILKEKHPDDYRKIIAVFPLAEMKVQRSKKRRTLGLDVDQQKVRGRG